MAQGKNKKAAFLQQSQDIVKRTQALFKERQRSSTVVFYKASRVEHVKPMFELVWMSFLVTFSGPMQDSVVRPTWLARSRPRRAAPPPPFPRESLRCLLVLAQLLGRVLCHGDGTRPF